MEALEYYPEARDRDTAYVYLIRAENGLVKIGKAVDVTQRCSDLSNMSPVPLAIVHCQMVRFPYHVERALHSHFAAVRHHGEWFTLNDEQFEEAKSLLQDSEALRTRYKHVPNFPPPSRTKLYKGLLLSTKAINALEYLADSYECESLAEIAQLDDRCFLATKNCGLRTTFELRTALFNAGYPLPEGYSLLAP